MKKFFLSAIAIVSFISFIFGIVGCSNTEYSFKNPAPMVGETSDYSTPKNWFKLPEKNNHDVDVIYFYPTLYSGSSENDPMICDIDNQSMRSSVQNCYDSQASVFETVGDIYIPFYRQVDFSKIHIEDKDKLYSYISREPRTDVFGALDYYFKNLNNGRPFILAGHSQGSMMLSMVLSEYMKKNPEYLSRMIATYHIGYSITKDFLNDNPQIKAASRADDTGVIISFNMEAPSNLGQNNIVVQDNSVCINPITWTTDDNHVSKSLNKGSRMKNSSGQFEVLEHFADAKIKADRGTVICTSVNPDIYAVKDSSASIFGPGSYHFCEYELYYMNIRENAKARIEAYFSEQSNK